MSWLLGWWWARQRKIDVQVLWPACKHNAPTLELAQQAFMMHAMQCPCWVRHYGGRLWQVVSRFQ